MALVFWQEAPSLHQAAFFRELCEVVDEPVHLVIARRAFSERGPSWSPEQMDFGSTLVHNPGSFELGSLETGSVRFNIVSGLRGHWLPSSRQLSQHSPNSKLVVMSEPVNESGLLGRFKLPLYKNLVRLKGRRPWLALGTGELGAEWLSKALGSGVRVAEWAYFVADAHGPVLVDEVNELRAWDAPILCVGEVCQRKNIHNLVRGFSASVLERHLILIGGGADVEVRALEELIESLDDPRIQYLGELPYKRTRQLVAKASLLALVSHFDGWGAVVQEALLEGTPVMITRSVGSSVLVDDKQRRGVVLQSGQVEEIARALNAINFHDFDDQRVD